MTTTGLMEADPAGDSMAAALTSPQRRPLWLAPWQCQNGAGNKPGAFGKAVNLHPLIGPVVISTNWTGPQMTGVRAAAINPLSAHPPECSPLILTLSVSASW